MNLSAYLKGYLEKSAALGFGTLPKTMGGISRNAKGNMSFGSLPKKIGTVSGKGTIDKTLGGNVSLGTIPKKLGVPADMDQAIDQPLKFNEGKTSQSASAPKLASLPSPV